MSKKLSNYLTAHRKRLGLSQDEVAFLVAAAGRAAVSLHERSDQGPSLHVLLAYQALFGISPGELFAGDYAKVEQDVARRARELAERLAGKKTTRRRAFKLESLRGLRGPAAQEPHAKEETRPRSPRTRPRR
jgi:transcriptional regulator with XRE-family HTH domain